MQYLLLHTVLCACDWDGLSTVWVCISGVPTDHAATICAMHVQVKQKGGTVEQIVIADMAFDVLKTAWAKFESGELRK